MLSVSSSASRCFRRSLRCCVSSGHARLRGDLALRQTTFEDDPRLSFVRRLSNQLVLHFARDGEGGCGLGIERGLEKKESEGLLLSIERTGRRPYFLIAAEDSNLEVMAL